MCICFDMSRVWKVCTKNVIGILSFLLLILILPMSVAAVTVHYSAVVRASDGHVYEIQYTKPLNPEYFWINSLDEVTPSRDVVAELYIAAGILNIPPLQDLGDLESFVDSVYEDTVEGTVLHEITKVIVSLPGKIIMAKLTAGTSVLDDITDLAAIVAGTTNKAAALIKAYFVCTVFAKRAKAYEQNFNEHWLLVDRSTGTSIDKIKSAYTAFCKQNNYRWLTINTVKDHLFLPDSGQLLVDYFISFVPYASKFAVLGSAAMDQVEMVKLQDLLESAETDISNKAAAELDEKFNEDAKANAISALEGEGFFERKPPMTVDSIDDIDLMVGDAPILRDVITKFSDPNGDKLVHSLQHTDENVADVKWILFRPDGELEFRSFLEITPKNPGTTMVTITATDPNGLSASLTFTVIVTGESPYEPPEARRVIDPIELTLGGDSSTVDVEQNFNASNPLTFSVDSIPRGIVTTSVSETIITITPVAVGVTTVEVTARDTVTGLTAVQTISVSVRQTSAVIIRPPNPDPTFSVPGGSNPRAEGLKEGVSVITQNLSVPLRVREGAGTNHDIIEVIGNSLTGIITDGPRQANGYTWWKVEWDSVNLEGWSAEVVDGVQLLFRRPPDLEIRDLDVSDSQVGIDEEIELEVEIRNNGPGESAATDVYFYYHSGSRNNDLEELARERDLRSAGKLRVPSLRERRSTTLTLTVDAPPTPDRYYYGAFLPSNVHNTDYQGDLEPDMLRNNLAREERVQVTGSPDYIVESISTTKTTLDPGETFTLRATVRNQGQGEPTSSADLDYYRSSDARISTSDRWVGDDSVSRLDTDETGNESVSLTAPTEPGVYYYGACVSDVRNESSDNNNCSAAVAITVRPTTTPVEITGSPDLVVSLSSTSNNSLVDPNGSINLEATVQNQGAADASNSTTLRYYRSTDAAVSSDDQLIATDSVRSLIQGSSGDEDHGARAPSQPGQYYYYVCVDSVTDEDETGNNCSNFITINVRGADLVVESVSVDLLGQIGSINPNGEFTLNATIRNQGTGTAAATTARYYISTDQTFSELDDSEVQSAVISAINIGASSNAQSPTIRSPYTSGVFYCFVCVDGLSNEINTENNCSEAIRVTIRNVVPRARGTIPAQTLNVGTPKSLAVSNYFVDDNNDTITYSVNSSDNSIATASASGLQVTITPKNAGSATITVTANDGTLTATQTFAITVPQQNRAPVAVGTIAAQTLTIGDSPIKIDVSSNFRDVDKDTLTYTATSNKGHIATATVSGTQITIAPIGEGNATITVTASDGKLSTTQTISVSVMKSNRAPVAVGTIAAQTLTIGDSPIKIDVSSNFSDLDNDTLTYTATSNKGHIATAIVSDYQATITPISEGNATITVTASDGKLSATQTISVSVMKSNRAPVAAGTISERTLTVGASAIVIDVSSNFQDSDGDNLTFTANSDTTSVADASASDSQVTIAPVSSGSATITVTASDGTLTATQTISVTVNAGVSGETWMPDENLRAKIRSTLGLQSGETLTQQAMNGITRFVAENSQIGNLTGLEHATNVGHLQLKQNQIADITPLKNLIKLGSIDLASNQIADITPLKNLTALAQLWIGGNQISDITPLKDLTALTLLSLGGNQISDITPLSGLTELDFLGLQSNQISDVTPLKDLTGLNTLHLHVNQINDVTPLEGLISLTNLVLRDNPIVDVTPLGRLKLRNPNVNIDIEVNTDPTNNAPVAVDTISTQTLTIGGSSVIVDVSNYFQDADDDTLNYSASSSNTNVVDATVFGSDVTLTPVGVGSTIVTVEASDGELIATQIISVSVPAISAVSEEDWMPDANLRVVVRSALGLQQDEALTQEAMTGLTLLSVVGAGIKDLTGLEHATNLNNLSLPQSQISVLTPLENLTALTAISLSQNQVRDITPLEDLTALTYLSLSSNHITDITPLEDLTALTSLNLGVNQISDITPLEDLTALTWLYLGVNQISDVTSLENLTALTRLYLTKNSITDYAPLRKLKLLNPDVVIDIDITVNPNRPPMAVGTISDRTLTVGGSSVQIDVSSNFRDPDNDNLEYTASSNNNTIAAASLTGSQVTITPISAGSTIITVTANDGSLTATQTFSVTVTAAPVSNHAPVTVSAISDQTLVVGGTSITVDVSANFSDPDNDTLTYDVSSSNTSIVTESVSGAVVTITPVAAGSTTITVTATDGTLTASQTISITVAASGGEETWMPDANLRAAVRSALGYQEGEELTQEAMKLFTSFRARESQIRDLTGLEYATNLTNLDLGYNEISDITPIDDFTKLTRLYLAYNQISDITPLEDFTELNWLMLHNNVISDITPLEDITKLKHLALSNNQISDISPLAGMTTLPSLVLSGNEISDITTLSQLTSLTSLSLDQNEISSFIPLENMTGLGFLDCGSCSISDITFLENLTSLSTLRLNDNQISDLTPLEDLTAMTALWLNNNQISDLTPLEDLTAIYDLKLSDNQISDLTSLEYLTKTIYVISR